MTEGRGERGEGRGERGERREGYVVACLLDKNSGTQTFAYEGLAVIRTPELDKVGKILHVRVSTLAIFCLSWSGQALGLGCSYFP